MKKTSICNATLSFFRKLYPTKQLTANVRALAISGVVVGKEPQQQRIIKGEGAADSQLDQQETEGSPRQEQAIVATFR